MPFEPSSSRDDGSAAIPSLDTAVPAQEQAKSVLRTEFAVFRAQGGADALAAQPVLLWGNQPGRIPAALGRALADEAGLPWVEVTVGPGFSAEQIMSRLARQTPHCREGHPLGIALLGDLQHLSVEAAHMLVSQLAATDRTPHLHQGRRLSLSPQQVFWVGSMQVREPTRQGGRSDPRAGGTSFALLAVGPGSTDMVATGVTGQVRAAGPDEEQAACFAVFSKIFKANALLLPGTRDDLVAWALEETATWWPGRRLRTYCAHHGVDFVMGPGAAEALAEEAARLGGTVDVMEDRLRLAMEPVLAAIADGTRDFAAVEMTPAALAHSEAPRLVVGPRRPPVTETANVDPSMVEESGIERPPRTPLSSPDVRLARAADLITILSPESVPLKP